MKCSSCKKSIYHSKEDASGSLEHQKRIGNLNFDLIIENCTQCSYWVMSRKHSHSEKCNKNIYKTETEAKNVKKQNEKEKNVFLKIYFCTICNGYHLTKNLSWFF